jgi:hypothetical protein
LKRGAHASRCPHRFGEDFNHPFSPPGKVKTK